MPQPAPLTEIEIQTLLAAARAARRHAYAPYSRFRVGAAILTTAGAIISGCNVENASYGLTNCAERTAIFTARAAGQLGSAKEESAIRAVAVVAAGPRPPTPCGACRQVLVEFGPECQVICANLRGEQQQFTIAELLPASFSL